MSLKYRTSAGTSASNFSDLVVKVGDTLPIGTEVDYDGQTVPAGWQEVDDPNVYSTAETRIGTWIDGKPLYRKVTEFTNQTTSYYIGIANVKNICNLKTFVYRTDYPNLVSPIPSRLNRTDYGLDYNYINKASSGLAIEILWGTSYSSNNVAKVQFIIEYTKTTD